ncbi:MAG: DUF805 domain-containing protein [Gammaproteobacteria bacterium]|nr:DUF805 domain-containing protein [Gammaproteobacteria bacterium]
MNNMITKIKEWLDYKGRTRRLFYWLKLILLLPSFLIAIYLIETHFSYHASLFIYPLFLWPLLVNAIRRYHDLDKSGWWLLLLVIPILGPLIVFLELGFRKAKVGDNSFGANPRDRSKDYMTVGS